jgi:hypothetical protein
MMSIFKKRMWKMLMEIKSSMKSKEKMILIRRRTMMITS